MLTIPVMARERQSANIARTMLDHCISSVFMFSPSQSAFTSMFQLGCSEREHSANLEPKPAEG